MDKEIKKSGHLVLVPCPLQGHMNPMLHLAKVLHCEGFFVTIIHTQLNPPNPSHYPEFFFESIDHGLLDDGQDASDHDHDHGDVLLFLSALNIKCKIPFQDCLAKRRSKNRPNCDDPILCIIHDAAMYFLVDVADELEIPRIVLRTSAAATFIGLSLLKQICLPIPVHKLEEPLVEFPLLRIKDMPVFSLSSQEVREEVLASIDEGTKTASAIIWNTLSCLEQTIMEKIQEVISVPSFPIGPLHKHFATNDSSSSFLTEDQSSIISWLDAQTPNSVIYISIGSLVAMNETEFVELAWGLANSGQPFLWVVRPGLISNGSNGVDLLPKEFNEIMRKRGRVTKWAPQHEVLSHQSIGGFLTHNGWNSTIESISEGVPMLCWPRVGDQRVIARFVSHVWRVGIQLEDTLEKGNIEKGIRRLLVDKEGMEIKKRAMKLKEMVDFSLGKGGSSCEFLCKLVSFIKLL